MENENESTQNIIVEFFINYKKDLNMLILPSMEDHGMTDSELLESERQKIMDELSSELEAWDIKSPKNGITEKNFYKYKGQIKKKIIDRIISIGTGDVDMEGDDVPILDITTKKTGEKD